MSFCTFVTNLCTYPLAKNYQNRSRFNNVIAKIKRFTFLLHPVDNYKTRRMAIANGTCVSWVGYAHRTIAVNVTWMKREFTACQTHRSMYPSTFNRFPVIQPVSSKVRNFSTFFCTFACLAHFSGFTYLLSSCYK